MDLKLGKAILMMKMKMTILMKMGITILLASRDGKARVHLNSKLKITRDMRLVFFE